MFDADYLSHTYSNIVSKHLIFDNPPTFAASSVFTPLELSTKENEPERICINIFSLQWKKCTFCFLVEEKMSAI